MGGKERHGKGERKRVGRNRQKKREEMLRRLETDVEKNIDRHTKK